MPIKLEFRVVVYLKLAKRHTRELNWYCHLVVLGKLLELVFYAVNQGMVLVEQRMVVIDC